VADTAPLVAGFVDRLGDRVRLMDRGTQVEVLRLRPELTASPLFEGAARRRTEQLARLEHPNYARVLQVARLAPPDGRLVIVSEAVDGWRLSEVLEAADRLRLPIHSHALIFLLRQLFGAVSSLHAAGPGLSHGALGTERLVLARNCRLVVTESVFGGALRYLPVTAPDRLWREHRLAVADGEVQPFGRLTDLRQIGVIGLSVALGRQLRRDEPPSRLSSVMNELPRIRSERDASPLGPALHGWLAHVLSLDGDETPWSVAEAQRELNQIVQGDGELAFEPTGLGPLLQRIAEYYADDSESPKVSTAVVPPRPSPEPALTVGRRHDPADAHPDVPAAASPTANAVAVPLEAAAPGAVGETHAAVAAPDTIRASPVVAVAEPPAPAIVCCEEPVALEVVRPPVTDATPAAQPAAPAAVATAPGAPRSSVALDPVPTPPVVAVSPAPPPPLAPPRLPAPFVATTTLRPATAPLPAHRDAAEPLAFAGPFASMTKLPDRTLATGVIPVAEEIALEPPKRASATDLDRPHRDAPPEVRTAPSRSLFGVDLSDDVPKAARRPARKRVGMLVGLGTAALVIVVAGGYPLLRSNPVTATAMPPSSPPAAAPTREAPAAPAPAAPAPPSAAPLAAPAPAPAAASEPANGLVEVVSPLVLDVSEGGRALGTSGQPIRLPLGRHTLEFVREDLGYRATQVVDLREGRREQVRPSLPSGEANLNATPWAEVWVDGRSLGETPLGNVQLTIGPHEVTFRHPELGEQTRTLVVTVGVVARLSVELRK
jgi:hypothetical protein